MSQKSNELKAQGVDVINLSVGEPDFHTPDHIKEAAKKAIDENFTFYTPVAGYMTLRKAIAAKMKNENGLDFAPEQIVVSGGAKQSLCNVILATINPGDEVVIPTPAWVSYVEMVKLAEGKTVTVPAGVEQDFKITPEQLEAAITPRTRMLLLCSPSNPTGSVYTHDELKALADVLAKYPDILVLSDEIYEHINFTGKFASISEFDAVRDRSVDLLRHHRRVGLVLVAPERLERLDVALPLRPRLLHVLPLADALREDVQLRPPGLGLVGGPDVGGDVVLGGRGGSRQKRAGGRRRQPLRAWMQ